MIVPSYNARAHLPSLELDFHETILTPSFPTKGDSEYSFCNIFFLAISSLIAMLTLSETSLVLAVAGSLHIVADETYGDIKWAALGNDSSHTEHL